MVKIESFDFEEDLINDFINFPWKIYHQDSNWNPPLKEVVKKQLSPEYPFYKHGIIRNFLAVDNNDNILGRISAIINYNLEIDGEKIGHVGFFECVNDYNISKTLLDSALAYLKEKNIRKVWGPLNFATLYNYRFVTKGFDKATFYSDLYNPPYYPEFFEKYGFYKIKTYYSNLCTDLKAVSTRYAKFKKRFDELGFTSRNIDFNDYDKEFKIFYELLFECFKNNYGFSHMDYDEFLCIYGKYNQFVNPKHFLIAFNPENKPVGFYMAYPDFTGHHKKAFLTKLMGVLPEYAYAGVGMALVYEMTETFIKEGYEYLLAPLRIEGNSSLKFGKGIYQDYKEYGLYEIII